jgi:hypothetical protein
MSAQLASERFDGFYWYSVFNVLLLILSCSTNTNFSAPKIEALQVGHGEQNGDFLENGHNDLDYILVIYLDYYSK